MDVGELPNLDSFAARLGFLFETVRPVGKPRYSTRAVAAAIKEQQGLDISHAYINHLVAGERDNPGIQQVSALAKFFGVPPAYLLGDGDIGAIAQELRQLQRLIELNEGVSEMDDDLRGIVVRARGVPRKYLQVVKTMLDQVREIEGLDRENREGSP